MAGAREAQAVSSASPREIIDSQRGNDVVNTTAEAGATTPPVSVLRPPSSSSLAFHFVLRILLPRLNPRRCFHRAAVIP